MNTYTAKILEKYNPDNILSPILEHYNSASIKGGSFVVICPKALKDPDIAKELKMKRGLDFYGNLMLLADKKQPMYVSALKMVKPTSAYMAETAPNNFEEADLLMRTAPGFYRAPITVPTSILKTIVDPMFIHQLPISSEFVQQNRIVKSETLPNEYNNGEQPQGSIVKGGNTVGASKKPAAKKKSKK